MYYRNLWFKKDLEDFCSLRFRAGLWFFDVARDCYGIVDDSSFRLHYLQELEVIVICVLYALALHR